MIQGLSGETKVSDRVTFVAVHGLGTAGDREKSMDAIRIEFCRAVFLRKKGSAELYLYNLQKK